LWLIPAVAVLLPTRPPRSETSLEAISLPAAEVSRLYSAAEAWAAPTAIPWEALWLVVGSFRFRRNLLSTAVPFVPTLPRSSVCSDSLCR
jgi:hypothetical protein